MTTSTLEVGDLLSVLGAHGIERQLQRVAGVGSVSVNPVSGSTTVVYDPATTSISAIQAAIEDCGFHCTGEALPRHVCASPAMPSGSRPAASIGQIKPADVEVNTGHARMAPAGMKPADGKTDHKAHGSEKSDAMAHEMGHGAGMDMQDMVRDMRNRFLVSLVFTLPIFAMAPMGMGEPWLRPPFGLSEDLAMFLFASAAILYPVWPFVVAAWRALRNGVLNMAVLVVLSVGTGYLFSVGSTFFSKASSSMKPRAVLLVFILLGHWLEMRARAGASAAIRALLDLAPPKATVVPRWQGGRSVDRRRVARRHRRPAARQQDPGRRRGDRGRVDRRRIDAHRRIDAGDQEGRATRSSARQSTRAARCAIAQPRSAPTRRSAQIVKLVQEAQNSKAPAQLLADRASQWLVLAAIVIGLATFAVWFWWIGQPLLFALTPDHHGFRHRLSRCLGLATPMAVMVGTGLGAIQRYPVQERGGARRRDQTQRDRLRQDRHADNGSAQGRRDRCRLPVFDR